MRLSEWENPREGIWWRRSIPKGIIICRITLVDTDHTDTTRTPGYHWQVGAVRQFADTLEKAKSAADSEISWCLRERPTEDIEDGILHWMDILHRNNETKQDVVRAAARELALRDKRIEDLQQQVYLQEPTISKDTP